MSNGDPMADTNLKTTDMPKKSTTPKNPQTPSSRSPSTPCSALPRVAGFYWWRETIADEWRMVEITPSSDGTCKPGEMHAYDRERGEWGGRNLQVWEALRMPGKWILIRKPNAGILP